MKASLAYKDGTRVWILNGKSHRVDGPAIEYPDGTKAWYLNGVLHRKDGPAVEWANGSKDWFLNGVCLFGLPRESQPFIVIEELGSSNEIKVLTQGGIEIWPNLPGLKELAEN
jgi:hypothetical protein